MIMDIYLLCNIKWKTTFNWKSRLERHAK